MTTSAPASPARLLIAVGGRVASGKSTIARRLAERLALPRLEADGIHRELAVGDALRELGAGFEARVYEELIRRARRALETGRGVVLDACFPRRAERLAALGVARDCDAAFLFVECRVDPETARSRLDARDAPGHAGDWRTLYDDLDERWEPVQGLEPDEHLTLDCSLPVEASEAPLRERLRALSHGRPTA